MSLFDLLFKNRPKPKETETEFKTLTGYEPHFTRFGGSIYESELVRAAINAIATHVSKLDVRIQGTAKPSLQIKLQHGANQFQTWPTFLYRLCTILYIHNTAFIVPVFDEFGQVSGVYAPLPENCTLVQYDNVPYVRYKFGWGEYAAIELDSTGIMTRYQYKSDWKGESNSALIPTMDLIRMQNEGIQEGVKSSATYRFMARLSNFAKPSDIALERKRFTAENLSRDAEGGGLLLFPNTYGDIKQIESKPFVADADTMRIIRDSVYEYFGVNEAILTSAAYGDAWSAFYESVVEPFSIQLSATLERMLFTFRERSVGNKVVITANRLQYMTNADKLNVSSAMLDRGIMSINDVRAIWQLPPVDGGDVRIIRGEYYTADERVNNDEQNSTAET